MKRSMDLVRELLLEIESLPAGQEYESTGTSLTADRETLHAHLELLAGAGLIEPLEGDLGGNLWTAGMTWRGHEFLDATRNDGVWQEAKRRLREKGLTATLGIMQDLCAAVLKGMLGLA